MPRTLLPVVMMVWKPFHAARCNQSSWTAMDSSKFIGCMLGYVEVGSREADRKVGLALTFALPGLPEPSARGKCVEGHPLFPVAILVGHIKNLPDNPELHV